MSNGSIEHRFAAALPSVIQEETDEQVLVACSGGGDSIALLHLAAGLLGSDRIRVATVDHHLRDVQAELDLVARHCATLNVPHAVLDWHWDGQGNLQAAARNGRRDLLETHADKIDAYWLLLGHTLDDQAETFLMRLARGSGVDGLAGMAAYADLTARPLLDMTRAELRDWLQGQGLDWAEDPSNSDRRFDRVKARGMMDQLETLGLTRDRLVATANRMEAEREALIFAARQFGQSHSQTIGGDVLLERAAFAGLPVSLQTRVLAALVRWFSGSPYKPRAEELDQWRARIETGKPAPLSGVLAHAANGTIRFYREPAAVAGPTPIDGEILWDNRWRISPPGSQSGITIAPLGAALSQYPDWRDHPLPRTSLQTSPAIWRDGACIASLILNPPAGWSARATNWLNSLK